MSNQTFCRRQGRTLWLMLLLALALPLGMAAGAKVYNVRDFGGKGDGASLDTAAIQQALDQCAKSGGGIVLLPSGNYLSKPLVLHSGTTLKLDAGTLLKATDDPADFADPNKPGAFIPFIGGRQLTNVTLLGPGTIDGSGQRWWIPAEQARRKTPGFTLPRPRLILFNGCKNLRLETISLQNSPSFHFVPMDCEDVVVTNVTITAPQDSPNTDAIDPSSSRRMLITHCRLDVGDDNVAIKAGHAASSEDITVADCTMLHGHGMSIGSETSGGIRHVLVRNCTFQDTENGIRIKSPRGKGGIVEDVVYRDITMQNVDPAITITCYYPKIPRQDPAQAFTPQTPVFRNLVISNLTATCRRDAGLIIGLPESPVTGVRLENLQITAARDGFTFRNAKDVQCHNVQVKAQDGPPFLIQDAQVEGLDQAANSATRPPAAPEWAQVPAILARIQAPVFPDRVFPITDFGARPGGEADCSEAIAKAIAACVQAGGGRVVVPAGVFLTGPIRLQSKVNLHLERDATLRFKTNTAAYLPAVPTRFEGMECYNYSPLIYAFEQQDIAVTGDGVLDGQADERTWWPWKGGKQAPAGASTQKAARDRLTQMVEQNLPVDQRRFGEGDCLRPSFIEPYRCRNVLIAGVRIRRSPMWELHPTLCTNVIVRDVDIFSHGPNNDGCDPECCRDVLIEHCIFDTGDDCIAIKSGRNNDGRRLGCASENLVIRGCTMKDGHGGVVIGSEISGGCRNVFAEDCRMDSPRLERVLRLKSNAARGGVLENIFIRNSTVEQVADAVLQIDFLYEEGARGSFSPSARNIVLENVSVSHAPRVLDIVGFPGAQISGVRVCGSTFQDIQKPDVVRDASAVEQVGCVRENRP